MKKRRIGVDLDNTIACYERVFEPIAQQMGLISERAEGWTKLQIRETLQKKRKERSLDAVAGRGLWPRDATGLPPLSEFESIFSKQRRRGHEIWIVSHRSRRPAVGAPHDLWLSAFQWLNTAGLLRPEGKVSRNRLLLAPTREAKVREIIRIGCTDFIDDLPEVFSHPLFPGKYSRPSF